MNFYFLISLGLKYCSGRNVSDMLKDEFIEAAWFLTWTKLTPTQR